jgi:ABC-type branched-subunit amino acid transport system substrate-binding protein
LFIASSQTDPQTVIAGIGKSAEGLVTASGYPSLSADLPIALEFKKVMTEAGYQGAQINSMAFEAYVNAVIFFEALSRTGKDLTREAVFKKLETMNDANFKGLDLKFSPKNHQALSKVYLQKVSAGKVEPLL